jgi:hypothetical protein
VALGRDGTIAVTGYSDSSDGDFAGTPAGVTHGVVGFFGLDWSKLEGDLPQRVNDVVATPDGFVTAGAGSGGALSGYSAAGDQLWEMSVGTLAEFSRVAAGPDGGVVALGRNASGTLLVDLAPDLSFTWDTTYPGSLVDIAATSDGGAVAVGTAAPVDDGPIATGGRTGTGGTIGVLVKFDAAGMVEWTQSLDGYDFRGVAVTADGNVVTIADREGGVVVAPGMTAAMSYVTEFSPTGDQRWESLVDHLAKAEALAVLADGRLAVAGSVADNQAGLIGGYIAVLNPDGTPGPEGTFSDVVVFRGVTDRDGLIAAVGDTTTGDGRVILLSPDNLPR